MSIMDEIAFVQNLAVSILSGQDDQLDMGTGFALSPDPNALDSGH